MRQCFPICAAVLFLALVAGCGSSTFDDSDQIVSVDKTVNATDLKRVTTHLLAQAPQIRAEQERLVKGGKKVRLTLSILAAPEPAYTKNDPDYRYHANYYWIYVSYSSKEGLVKYKTYLVEKDLADVYVVDSDTDTFVKVGR